jgi:hypothetical protein
MKNRILLGGGGSGEVAIDLPTLIKTRLLIQANSGGGKSFLIRRLAEQLFGTVPVIIIDPEGEFATLREKYDYVLAGPGGETPADIRSAGLLAHKLLELRASAVCDLYEMKPQDRHQWVKLFLDSLINAPKKLWGPTVVIIDEVHQFCPESKTGESVASGSVVDLATRGRKRGYCSIFATQRLGKLRKDAAAELLNVMIGMTFIDIDRDRAVDSLGVSREEKQRFNNEIKLLEPGNFYCLGRAISKDRLLVKVGSVLTTHPEAGGSKFTLVPPSPAGIKALLPKLADLPKAVEEQATTVAGLKQTVTGLRREILELKKAKPPTAEPSKVLPVKSESALSGKDRASLAKLGSIMGRVDGACEKLTQLGQTLNSELSSIKSSLSKILSSDSSVRVPTVKTTSPVMVKPMPVVIREVWRDTSESESADYKPSKCRQKILGVLAQYPDGCTIGKIALLSGYHVSGGFKNELAYLRTHGLILGGNTELMRITSLGLEKGPFDALPVGSDFVNYWMSHSSCSLCMRRIMQSLIDNPVGLDISKLAEASGYQVSGGFKNELARLRTAGLLVGKNTGTMTLAEEFFNA